MPWNISYHIPPMISDSASIAGVAAPVPHPPRLSLDLFGFSRPFLPAAAFDFSQPAHLTNTQSYAIVFDDREIPFKVLRSDQASGSRPILVLLHGMGLHIASFRGIAGYLLEVCDLVLIDYNSFAGTGWPPGGPSIRMLMHEAMRVPRELGLSRICICGSSLGGGMGMMAALDYPQIVDSLVFFNPAILPQELPRLYNLVRVPIQGEFLMTTISAENLIQGVIAKGYADPKKADPQLMDLYRANMATCANRFKLLDVIRQLPTHYGEAGRYLARVHGLAQRVLLIWGRRDDLLDKHAPEQLLQTFPHIDFRNFPFLAHLPHEEAPDRIGPIVAKFIARST
jgi:pimeloyl-ACP methyl ester carboxylesterase